MTEKKTVTVAGVPVTVTVADRVLAVTVGRFDPAAAGGLLRIHPRYGTSAVGVFIADENGDTAHKPDRRWFFELHPGLPGSAGTLLLCDGCYQGATGRLPQCQDHCPHEDPGHAGQQLPRRHRCVPVVRHTRPAPRGPARRRRAPSHDRGRRRGPVVAALHRRPARPLPLAAGSLGRLARQPAPGTTRHQDGDPGMTAPDPGAVPGTETWTYGGIRADKHGKRRHAWLDADGEEHWFSRTGGQMAVGSHYTVQVTWHDGTLTLHGTPAYAGTRAGEDTRGSLWTEHTVAQTRTETLRAERNDARRNALDEAIAPLLEPAAPLRTAAQRDALAAYVIRKLHRTWSTR